MIYTHFKKILSCSGIVVKSEVFFLFETKELKFACPSLKMKLMFEVDVYFLIDFFFKNFLKLQIDVKILLKIFCQLFFNFGKYFGVTEISAY